MFRRRHPSSGHICGADSRSRGSFAAQRPEVKANKTHWAARARQASHWFGGALSLLLAASGCDNEVHTNDLTTTVGTLESRSDLGEYADNHELRLKFDLPSNSERRALVYQHGRIRLLAAEGRVELSARDLNQEVRSEGGAVFIVLPKSFDAIEAIVELELVDEAGSKVTLVRSVPRGYARSLPQRLFRSPEANTAARRAMVQVLDKDYGADGGGAK